jgi:aspartyl-tRNA(Asn)/glutamyl-tRNA(Gln) amidotransferase subunit A
VTSRIEAAVEAALVRASADAWNCISVVLRERALAEARKLDKAIAAGQPVPPLAGKTYVAKSLFDVKGEPTLAGGPADESIRPAVADAELIQGLSDVGAILIGIAHMDEYAYGFLGDNPHHGRVVNPRDPSKVTGGSSSGSAAAVAAGIVPFAIGSDTNGSVRVPGAFCGVYALKPSYGRLPLTGSRPLAQSLDHAGLLADSLDELESVWRALTPYESRHDTDAEVAIGFAAGDCVRLSDPAVRKSMHSLHAAWPEALTIDFDHIEESFAAASLITAFEAARNHSGTRLRVPHRYSLSIAARLDAAESVSEDEYSLASSFQEFFTGHLAQLFSSRRFQVLVLPCAPVIELNIGDERVMLNGVEVRSADAAGLFTRPLSLAGYPTLLIPGAGINGNAASLPGCALQLVAQPGDEHALFKVAREMLRRMG